MAFSDFEGVIKFSQDMYSDGWSNGASAALTPVTYSAGAELTLAEGEYTVDESTNTLYVCPTQANRGYFRLTERMYASKGDSFVVDFEYALLVDDTGSTDFSSEVAVLDIGDTDSTSVTSCLIPAPYPAQLGEFRSFGVKVPTERRSGEIKTFYPRLVLGRVGNSPPTGRRVVGIRNPSIRRTPNRDRVNISPAVSFSDIGLSDQDFNGLSTSDSIDALLVAMRDYMIAYNADSISLSSSPAFGSNYRNLHPFGDGGTLRCSVDRDNFFYRWSGEFYGVSPAQSFTATAFIDENDAGAQEVNIWSYDLDSEGLLTVVSGSPEAKLHLSGVQYSLPYGVISTFASAISDQDVVTTLSTFRPTTEVYLKAFPNNSATVGCVGVFTINTDGTVVYRGPGLSSATEYLICS